MQNRITVLGIGVNVVTMGEAISCCRNLIASKGLHLVATANAEMIMLAQQDDELAGILAAADLVVPDGAGVVWAARHQGCFMPERVAGYDLTQQLLAVSASQGHRVFFFGGAPGVAEQARLQAEKNYPGLQVVGVRDGFFKETEENNIIAYINAAKPDILLVALGVPKQEKWIWRHRKELSAALAIGVGGTFDVMAGMVSRAPLWMQKANLEWLYRLALQPSRMLRMMALPRFAVKVMLGKSIRQK